MTDEEFALVKTWYKVGSRDSEELNHLKGEARKWYANHHCEYIDSYIRKEYSTAYSIENIHPLLPEICEDRYYSEIGISNSLNGKIICVDFVETEGDKKLHIYRGKVVYEVPWEDEEAILKYWDCYENGDFSEIYSGDYDYTYCGCFYKRVAEEKKERELLKTIGAWPDFRNARVIYVSDGIDGNDLNATEEEILKYVNSINADIYVRVMIYDNPIEEEIYSVTGYYTKENSEIADVVSGNGSYGKSVLLKNEYISKNSEIPTISHMSYNRVYENGKYIVKYLDSYTSIFGSFINALDTNSAKNLISKNRRKNENIKQKNEMEIINLEILDNEEVIQEEIKVKKEKENEILATPNTEVLENKTLESVEYIVIALFIIAILVCIAILIWINKSQK